MKSCFGDIFPDQWLYYTFQTSQGISLFPIADRPLLNSTTRQNPLISNPQLYGAFIFDQIMQLKKYSFWFNVSLKQVKFCEKSYVPVRSINVTTTNT